MTKREKAGVVLVVTGFLLVMLGCCLVADNLYWWVSVAISGTGCALIALAENHKVVLVAPLTDFELAYLHAVKLGKDDKNGKLH